MNYRVWILLLFTVTAYGQTDTPKSKLDSLYKVIERGDSIIRHQAETIKKLQGTSYVINNTFIQQPVLTRKQKTWRWIERALFFGAVGTVIILKLEASND